jgi:predicted HAD superfamily phosphohydrolase YqeG
MAAMNTAPAHTAIVGDQMFTDILGGNRSGIYTIMVRPLERREFVYTRFVSRPPERLLLRWFRNRGHL